MPAEPRTDDAVPATDLVVSYCFPPYVDTAAIVAAKRVRAAGRPVDVIQNRMAGFRPTDDGLRRITGDLVRRRYEVPTESRFSTWRLFVPWVEQGLQQMLAWDREGPGYERMYSRAQYSASHLLAARIKLARPGLHWTAEFSDPLSHDVTGALRYSAVTEDHLLATLRAGVTDAGFPPTETGNLFEWAEVLPFALADAVMFTNAHQRDVMLDAVRDASLRERVRQVARVEPHPTLEPEFYSLTDPEYDLGGGHRHIGYFGNFYANREMTVVLDALTLLPEDQRSRIRLHLFAGEHDKLRPRIRRLGLQDVVRVGPFVNFLDFLALTRRMDVLLVSDAMTSGLLPSNPFLPSKWSDYRGSGTPVWGVVEPGSVLDSHDLAYRSPVGHTTGALQVLAQIAGS